MGKLLLTNQDKLTLQYIVTTKLREVILKGNFKNGDRLIQEEWAAKLGVSRMPIRDALIQLEVEGLVRNEPRRGAIVTPISVSDIEEIYQLRALLEVEAVERSLPNLTGKHIFKLGQLHEQMVALSKEDRDVEKFMKFNNEFHRLMRKGCDWRRIHNMIDTLWKGIPHYTPSLLSDHIKESHLEHEHMLKHIEVMDVENLKEVMKIHILRTRDNLVQMIERSEVKS